MYNIVKCKDTNTGGSYHTQKYSLAPVTHHVDVESIYRNADH